MKRRKREHRVVSNHYHWFLANCPSTLGVIGLEALIVFSLIELSNIEAENGR